MRQIQTACNLENRLTPQKSGFGAKLVVSEDQKAAIKAFLKEKPEHRLIPWWELPYWIDSLEGIRDSAIKRAL